MAKFNIVTVKPDGAYGPVLVYDNSTSQLTFQATGKSVVETSASGTSFVANAVSKTNPGRKSTPKTLKISLGLSCNYECNYCSQRFVPHAESTNMHDVDGFVQQLTEAVTAAPERVEFWGGEPLVYWKTLKPLAEKLRALYPNAHFNMITNGSLLDADKNQWLDEMGFGIGLSHDGPGYHVRGLDPLDDSEKRAAIMDLYARLHPQGRISINAMVHSGNQSRADIQAWLQQRFGDDVQIGEGAFIDPYDEGGLASTFKSISEHIRFRNKAFDEIRTGKIAQFHIGKQKIWDFVQSIQTGRSASALGQKCGMDKEDSLVVDLQGNAITCQNVSAAATALNGESHKIGQLGDLSAVAMKTATHWSHRQECANCPVLQLCKGSCMFLEGPLWNAGCDAAYTDNIPFFAAAIEMLTGYIPLYIGGDFRQERKDIFGRVHGIPTEPKKRVIPIRAI